MTARLSDDVTDVIVDTETTGTNPQYGAIIQLCAVKFNYKSGAVGEVFNRCLSIAPNRFWSEDTRRWWGQQKREVLESIIARMEEPGTVIRDYYDFICKEGRPIRFWSRGAFDFYFLASYMEQYGLEMPHQFWAARDTRSFLAGLFRNPDEPDMDWVKTGVKGNAHDALYDNVVELKRLFNARDGIFHEILPPEEVSA